LSVVAVALVNLRRLASGVGAGEQPTQQVGPPRWVHVLSVWRYRAVRPLTTDAFVKALAQLGGWIPRK